MVFPARRLNGFDERIGAAAFHGDGRQHGHAELGGEARHVYVHAAPGGDVHAIERQHHGQAEALHFEREAQADGQVHRVDHAHHEFGSRRIRDAAQQHVARDGFIERRRAQAVGARQIEDAQHAAVERRRARLRGVRR